MGLLNNGGEGTGASTEGTQQSTQTQQQSNQQSQGSQQQGGQSSWRDSLPPELKDDPSLQSFNDVSLLAKSYVETKKLVGKKGVILPTDKDGDEAWSNFYNQVRPAELDKYDVKAPEGSQVTPEFIKVFKELAHKNGLPTKAANSMLGAYLSIEANAKKAQDEKRELEEKAGIEELQKEFGKAFDFKVSVANRMIEESKIPGLREWIEKSGNANNPYLVRLLAKLGEASSEDTVAGSTPGGRLTRTPDEIQSEINEIMNNKTHPKHEAFRNGGHPNHRDALKYVESLWKQLG